MAAKRVVVAFVDASGEPVAGITVKATGCGDLISASNGQVIFLITDDEFTVTADGADVYSGSLSSVPEMIKLTQNGSEWKAD